VVGEVLGRLTGCAAIYIIEDEAMLPPLFQSLDDGKEFSVIDIVVALCFNKWFGHKIDRMPEAVFSNLREDCSTGWLRVITLKVEGGMRVGLDKHRSFGESFLEKVKGVLLRQFPVAGGSFFSEVIEGVGKSREIVDEAAIKTRKARTSRVSWEWAIQPSPAVWWGP
jgi:hypothetical protein